MPDEIVPSPNKGAQASRDVFISYAHEDRHAAVKLVEELKQRGLRTWFDSEEIKPGDNWMERIKEGIDNSRFAIVILSRASTQKNKLISTEWAAIQESCWRKPNMPVVVLQVDDVETPAFLRDWSSLSCRRDSDWEAAADQIRGLMGTDRATTSLVGNAADKDASKRFTEIRKALEQVINPKTTPSEDER